jgi:murein DD-endopeptidase MepM/ murein hydrolase activator NlpD
MAGVVIAMLATMVPAGAGSYSERQQELDRLISQKRQQLREAEARERDILSEIRASDARRMSLQQRISLLNSRLNDANAQISVLKKRLDILDLQLHQKRMQVEQAQGQLDEITTRLNGRIQAIYIGVGSELSRGMQKLNNFDDVIAAQEYEAGIVASDQMLLQAVERAKENLLKQQAEIAATQQQVQADHAEVAKQAQRILETKSELADVNAAINMEIARKQVLLADVQAAKRAHLRAIRSYIEESNSIEAFLKGVQSGQNVIQGRGGWLKWPVSGPITSGYGWRTHPVYGHRSFHTGIDIGARHGVTVKAARYGSVIYTGYKGAYGNVVLIDHGSGIATLYAHLSRFYVTEGEYVTTQEAIAAVGSTGWSTGPHLHFEVRQGGEHVNPLRWL